MATPFKSSTQLNYGSIETSRLIALVKELISSAKWPAFTSPSNFQEISISLHHASQQALQELPTDEQTELIIDLCAFLGWRISGQNRFANWICPALSIELPFGLVLKGALLDIHRFQFDDQRLTDIVLSIANTASFVLVLDFDNKLQATGLKQDGVCIVSIDILINLITGILILHHWGQARHEILQRDAFVNQLKSFLSELGIDLETTQSLTRKFGLN